MRGDCGLSLVVGRDRPEIVGLLIDRPAYLLLDDKGRLLRERRVGRDENGFIAP